MEELLLSEEGKDLLESVIVLAGMLGYTKKEISGGFLLYNQLTDKEIAFFALGNEFKIRIREIYCTTRFMGFNEKTTEIELIKKLQDEL